MVDRLSTVVQAGLFDALQAQDLGVEVVVVLSAADVQGDVVVTQDVWIEFHGVLLLLVLLNVVLRLRTCAVEGVLEQLANGHRLDGSRIPVR
ncbi:hypothetical protein D9M70_588150 [compost metagenome]